MCQWSAVVLSGRQHSSAFLNRSRDRVHCNVAQQVCEHAFTAQVGAFIQQSSKRGQQSSTNCQASHLRYTILTSIAHIFKTVFKYRWHMHGRFRRGGWQLCCAKVTVQCTTLFSYSRDGVCVSVCLRLQANANTIH